MVECLFWIHSRNFQEPTLDKNCEKVPRSKVLILYVQLLIDIANITWKYGCSRLRRSGRMPFLDSLQKFPGTKVVECLSWIHSSNFQEPNSDKNCEKLPRLKVLILYVQLLIDIANITWEYGCSRLRRSGRMPLLDSLQKFPGTNFG